MCHSGMLRLTFEKRVLIVIQERVFMDPSMRLFEYNDKSLLASIPTMLAFPKVSSCLDSMN